MRQPTYWERVYFELVNLWLDARGARRHELHDACRLAAHLHKRTRST